MTLLTLSMAFAAVNNKQSLYNKAVSYEREGEYVKAESLYVDLYNGQPDNYNYYNRYRYILLLQRKYADLQPVIEKRLEKRTYDRYLKLELGILHFALEQEDQAISYWADVFKGQSGSMRESYASAVYQDALEYGLGMEFYKISDILRTLTKDPRLLVKYNFANCLRYRDWEQAVAEIVHILNTDADDLAYVKQQLFRFDPQSALYRRAIHALENISTAPARILLADIYQHLKDYDQAFRLLSADMDDESVRIAMREFAEGMFKQEEFELADRAAGTLEQHPLVKEGTKQAMALLSARAKERLFDELSSETMIVPYPFVSYFLDIEFQPFNERTGRLIKSAYDAYDSLSSDRGLYGELAAIHHADITYRVYQDFDAAIQEYYALSSRKNLIAKTEFLSKLSKLMLAKGEYSRAMELLNTATEEFGLTVQEEDQLLAQKFYVSIISGERDSLLERSDSVLAMFPMEDPMYNDLLAYSACVSQAMKDSINYGDWLQAERYLLMNNTASAIDIYRSLMDNNGKAFDIYGLRYLDCLSSQRDTAGEQLFWQTYLDRLLQGEMADYFILRYAAFQEKMQKYDISYEIFEKYLLSYRESMYYENIREYVREHYSLGAP
jgi:predicted negative regulator of RcsB-dependent stress response